MNPTQLLLQRIFTLAGIRYHQAVLTKNIDTIANPDSIASFARLLDLYRIPSIVVRLKAEKLQTVPLPALVHCSRNGIDFFAILESFTKAGVGLYTADTGRVTISEQDFASQWTGIALLLSPQASSVEPDFRQNRIKQHLTMAKRSLFFAALLLLTVSFLTHTYLYQGLGATLLAASYLTGLYLSILLIGKQFQLSDPWLDRFCHWGKASSCDKVLASSSAKLWGSIGWAEIGAVYFATCTLMAWFATLSANEALFELLSWISLLTLPFIGFSLFYQAFVIRVWCPLCLAVQAILGFNFLLLTAYLNLPDTHQISQGISLIGLSVCLPVLIWIPWRKSLTFQNEHLKESKSLKAFRSNTVLLTNSLLSQPRQPGGLLAGDIILGNHHASLTITIISNPFCSPCGQAHEQLKQWLDYYQDIRLIIRFFLPSQSQDQKASQVVRHLLALSNELYPDQLTTQVLNTADLSADDLSMEQQSKEQQSMDLHKNIQLEDTQVQDTKQVDVSQRIDTGSTVEKALSLWYRTKDIALLEKTFPFPAPHAQLTHRLNSLVQWSDQAVIGYTPTVLVNGYQLNHPYHWTDLEQHLRLLIQTKWTTGQLSTHVPGKTHSSRPDTIEEGSRSSQTFTSSQSA